MYKLPLAIERSVLAYCVRLTASTKDLKRMFFRSINHRDFTVARRLASWLFVIAFIATGSRRATASLILSEKPVSAAQLAALIDNSSMSGDFGLGWHSDDWSIGGDVAGSGDTRNYVSIPKSSSGNLPPTTPFSGVGIPGSSSATGADSGSSNGGNGASPAATLLRCVSELSRLNLVGWLRVGQALDVPPGPPFELLRPPQVLTILA